MIIKTSELEGGPLDWAIAVATGEPLSEDAVWNDPILIGTGHGDLRPFAPSRDWTDGGPLVEKWRVMLEPLTHMDHPEAGWHAGFPSMIGVMHGPTALVAAMRTIVAAELGKEVDVPDELAEARGEA